jgi:hypothetical protein
MNTRNLDDDVAVIVQGMMDHGVPLMQADAVGQALKFAIRHQDFARLNGLAVVYRLEDFVRSTVEKTEEQ